MNHYLRFFFDKNYRFRVMASKGLLNFMDDERYLKRLFRIYFDRPLNLDSPLTFNEKIQWLKLYDCQPVYTEMADKFTAKDYVANIIGEEYIIPTLGVWDRFEDVDFDKLPDQFVLKCTHDSGGLVICKDKSKFDKVKAKEKIESSLRNNYYYLWREYAYKDIPRRIIAEKYMEDEYGELRDYKFFCFDGTPKAMFVASDRQKDGEEVKFDFFDMDFNHLPMRQGHPNSESEIKRPVAFEKMKELAAELSKGIPHLRVDFYEIDGVIYFGELTFYHFSGFVPFEPEEWDFKWGEWLQLPADKFQISR